MMLVPLLFHVCKIIDIVGTIKCYELVGKLKEFWRKLMARCS
jgi:hypothetical protein